MAWQKGPGEGYMAAKRAALALDPSLVCRAIYWTRHGQRGVCGHIVERGKGGEIVGKGRLARDAWGDAYFKVGGKFPIPA